jgi:hypothetical protein
VGLTDCSLSVAGEKTESSCIHAPAICWSLDRTSRGVEWPARSLGLIPLDFYLSGGNLKALVYVEEIEGAGCFRERSIDACNTIACDTISPAINDWIPRVCIFVS